MRVARVDACRGSARRVGGGVTPGFRQQAVKNLRTYQSNEFVRDIAPAVSRSRVARWRDADRPACKICYERLRAQ